MALPRLGPSGRSGADWPGVWVDLSSPPPAAVVPSSLMGPSWAGTLMLHLPGLFSLVKADLCLPCRGRGSLTGVTPPRPIEPIGSDEVSQALLGERNCPAPCPPTLLPNLGSHSCFLSRPVLFLPLPPSICLHFGMEEAWPQWGLWGYTWLLSRGCLTGDTGGLV